MVLCYADLWSRDLVRQLAILVAAPYDFGLLFGQQLETEVDGSLIFNNIGPRFVMAGRAKTC